MNKFKPTENFELYDEIQDNLETIGFLAAVLIAILLMAAGAAWWLL